MKLYLAGDSYRRDAVKLYLAGDSYRRDAVKLYILESFYEVNPEILKVVPEIDGFLLDSGAFSFMTGKASASLDDYVVKYADFVKKNHIQQFFELDVDSITGYPKVKEYRKYLEETTGRKPIPVWHKSRGMDDFIQMCKEYDYVAIGGYVSGEFTEKQISQFPQLIKIAHKNNAKIHGLGFTRLACLPKYHFDSVDSTAWLSGNRFGYLYKFDGETIQKINKPPNSRMKNKETAINNFNEWTKFAGYAERNFDLSCM